ncbi:GNAT family N-acetyltransferase [Subtercola endophyticus]|uniref:GNAT family N-acetyltransferase n=1 Tax=Subtercola endophyticus TaxID=2895559 RepID=UPI001E5C839D|nr:GNAT family N-acetyltransferase [Subtercola endophyticus]UFS58582.1 N-acetyltransferase [Subtercola endophyticus]
MSTEIQNQPDKSRYVLLKDGVEAGLVDYRLHGDEIVFTHTEVDPAQRHEGIAGVLVQGALEDVRTSTGLKVVAQCPYVAEWINTHTEYHELVERG